MSDTLRVLLPGIPETLTITFGALVVGLVLGLPVAIMRRSNRRLIRATATGFIELVRAVPPIVWLFIIFYGLGDQGIKTSTMQAATAGLGLIATAYLAEIYRAGLNAVSKGQWEAGSALGLPSRALYRRVVLPQALIVVLPPAATYAIGLLKDSAIASVIGAQDLTFRAFQETQATLEGLKIFGITAVIYLVLSLPIGLLARYTGQQLATRHT